MGNLVIALALVFSAIMTPAAPDPKPGWLSDIYETPLPATGDNLMREAQEGRLEGVRDLVERGVDVNFERGSVLTLAAENGHVDVVKYLLAAGANPDGEPEGLLKGDPLRQAIKGNHLEVMDLLLEAGATVKFKKNSFGILDAPAGNGNLEALQKLLDAGADPNYNDGFALLLAGEFGHVEVLKALIDAGGDINADYGWIMNKAAETGQLESVKVLLEAGASEQSMKWTGYLVNYHQRMCYTMAPLTDFLFWSQEPRLALHFLTEKIDVSLKSAVSSGHLEIAKLLLEKGANPQYDGVLKGAATNGNVELVRILLEAGATIVYHDEYGFPLHFAASKGHIDVIKLLVQYGGDINKQLSKDTWWDYYNGKIEGYGNGWTVLHVLAKFGYPEIGGLINLGAHINAQDVLGRTPLHTAVYYTKLNVVAELLKFCSNVSLKDTVGRTVLDLVGTVVMRPPAKITSKYQSLMQTLMTIFPERISSAPHNANTISHLVSDFLALLRTNATFNETLKDADTSYLAIKMAAKNILEERDQRGLLEPFLELYCKPTLHRDLKISMGTEYLSKCKCVPGQGSVMTFTPLLETNICHPIPSTQESESSTAD